MSGSMKMPSILYIKKHPNAHARSFITGGTVDGSIMKQDSSIYIPYIVLDDLLQHEDMRGTIHLAIKASKSLPNRKGGGFEAGYIYLSWCMIE